MLNQIFEIRGYEKAQRDYDNRESPYSKGIQCRECGEYIEPGEYLYNGRCSWCASEQAAHNDKTVREYLSGSDENILEKFLAFLNANPSDQRDVMLRLFEDEWLKNEIRDFLLESDLLINYLRRHYAERAGYR